MKTNVLSIVLAMLISVFISGCATPQLVDESAPVGTIRINNYSDYAIGTVGIDNCDSFFAGQGGNRLPEGELIAAKSSYDFTVNTGCWDLLMYTYSSSVGSSSLSTGSTGTVAGKVMVTEGEIAEFNIGAEIKVHKKGW